MMAVPHHHQAHSSATTQAVAATNTPGNMGEYLECKSADMTCCNCWLMLLALTPFNHARNNTSEATVDSEVTVVQQPLRQNYPYVPFTNPRQQLRQSRQKQPCHKQLLHLRRAGNSSLSHKRVLQEILSPLGGTLHTTA